LLPCVLVVAWVQQDCSRSTLNRTILGTRQSN
jgi:hypothetical protein